MNDDVLIEDSMSVNLNDCLPFVGPARVFPSAIGTFFSPSGKSGWHGIYCKCI